MVGIELGVIQVAEELYPEQIAVGGEVMRRFFMTDKQIARSQDVREMVLELGKDDRVGMSKNEYELQAKRFVEFTYWEAGNMDRKVIAGKTPDISELSNAIQRNLDVTHMKGGDEIWFVDADGDLICISHGAGVQDSRLNNLITISVIDSVTGDRRLQYHLSPRLEQDRRVGPHTTKLQQIAQRVDGSIFNIVTGETINIDDSRQENMPDFSIAKEDPANYLIQLSRYWFNIIRANRQINKNKIIKDSWVPDVSSQERDQLVQFMLEIPFMVMEGKIDEATINEFKCRMMACFCINPKLFLNLDNNYYFGAIFPFFQKHEEGERLSEDSYRLLEFNDIDNLPGKSKDFEIFLRNIMKSDYDNNLSVLGNLAAIFKIGLIW